MDYEILNDIKNIIIKENISLRHVLFNYELEIHDDTSLILLYNDLAKININLADKVNLFLSSQNKTTQINIMTDLIKVIDNSFDQLPFVFIIPSYNNVKNGNIYKKNLDSIIKQNYSNYRILYCDDSSPDGTCDVVYQYIKNNQLENKIHLLKQYINQKQGAGRFICYQYTFDDEILIMLDGDDWLYDDNVLNVLNDVYKEKNILCSYVSYYVSENDTLSNFILPSKCFSEDDKTNKTYRHSDVWVCDHLRTGYAKLFKNVKLTDIIFEKKFCIVKTDCADMFPVLEMAGMLHYLIKQPLYIYNKDNTLSYDTAWHLKEKSPLYAYREKLSRKFAAIKPYETIDPKTIDSFYKNTKIHTGKIEIVHINRYNISNEYEYVCVIDDMIDYNILDELHVLLYYMNNMDCHMLLFDNYKNVNQKDFNYVTAELKTYNNSKHKCLNIKIGMYIDENNAGHIIETIHPGIYKTKTLLNTVCENGFYFVLF